MKSFIVRIYRHEQKRPDGLLGTVERVGSDGKKAFTRVDELWEILCVTGEASTGRRGSGRPGRPRRKGGG